MSVEIIVQGLSNLKKKNKSVSVDCQQLLSESEASRREKIGVYVLEEEPQPTVSSVPYRSNMCVSLL